MVMYDTPIEQFWGRLKNAAAKWAASDLPDPQDEDCRKIVVAEAHGLRLRDEILDYYVAEFCRMVAEKRERLDGDSAP